MHTSLVFASPEFLPLVEVAQRAERAGFRRVWTTETPGRDALVRALTFALRTSTIGVGTGIAYAFTRAPLAMAAAASDVDVASGGRFSLGIGAGTQGMRQRWYGVDGFDHPASRLEEYVEVMRTAWSAARRYRHDGQFYSGDYAELEGSRRLVPVWGSGINPTMLRIAARSCEGVAVHPLGGSLRYLDAVVLPAIRAGAGEAGRQPELALWRMTSIHTDSGVARDLARRSLAFYFSTPSYAKAADETGWGSVAEQVRTGARAGSPDWTSLGALIPEEMVDEFCLAGTPGEVSTAWDLLGQEYRSRGVTEAVFQTVGSGGTGVQSVRNLHAIVDVLSPQAVT